MLKNYIKIAIRNLLRSKVYSMINIAGLAIGMCCSILILLLVQDEMSYNTFHKDIENIHLVAQNQFYAGGRKFPVYNSPAPLSPALKNEYPEVVLTARFFPYQDEMLIQYGENKFIEKVKNADAAFFDVFTFPFVAGSARSFNENIHSLVITERTARKYFGDENAVGKILRVNNKTDFVVSGVLKDIPLNSDIQFDIIMPFETLKENEFNLDQWFSNSFYTFVKLREAVSYEDFTRKISGRLKKESAETKTELFLFPMSRFHLYSLDGSGGLITKIRLFTIIAFVILLIACINFMNLATARSAKRAKEVGLRKVVGAQRSQLIGQFFSESIILTLIALVLGVLLVEILLPGFNDLAGKKLAIRLFSDKFLLVLITVTLITGVVAGSYPALFLSSFSPAKVLKENLTSGTKGAIFRKVLVVFQFSLSIVLLISTFIVYSQLKYMKDKELGYNKENVLYVPVKGDVIQKYQLIKDELIKNPNVTNVTLSSSKPSFVYVNGGGWNWPGKNPNEDVLITFMAVEYDFAKTFGLRMAEGRFFSPEITSDSVDGCVINEKLASLIPGSSKIGTILTNENLKARVIGVLKDFNYNTVKINIEPLMMYISNTSARFLFVKLKGNDISSSVGYLRDVLAKHNPAYPFDYSFLDDDYDKMFKTEERLGKIFNYFAGLAIFISCLGLFGLSSFIAEQRRKEIGVRKVLGANVTQIVFHLSKSFLGLVLVSNIIAWPVAYLFMKDWLQDFAYKIDINVWIFVASALIALLIALVTVSYQAVKAAMINPVKSLRYE